MIIALCAALHAAAVPLLQAPQSPLNPATQAWLTQAQTQVATCQNDVRFLVALGQVLAQAGQPEAASEHLERALLISPQDPQALRAFAHVLRELGEAAAAAQLLAMVPPETHVLAKSHRGSATGRSATATPTLSSGASEPWKHLLSLTAGRERNPLGVSSQTDITLTLPGLNPAQPVTITLPIDTANRPRSASYAQLSAAAQVVRRSGGGDTDATEWGFQLGARAREVTELPQAGFSVLEAAVDRQHRPAGARWGHYTHATGAYLDSRTGIRFGQAAIGLGLLGGAGHCQGRLGFEALERRYLNNPILDGVRKTGVVQLACLPIGALTFRAGTEAPRDANRPGGSQRLMELRLRGAWGGWAWEADTGQLTDTTGYSPLIEAGAVRMQTRGSARLERSLLGGQGWMAKGCSICGQHQLLIGLEAQRRRSNLKLFESNNLGLYFTFQVTN